MTEKSRIKQRNTSIERYGPDYYKEKARKRWDKPGAKDNIQKDEKGRFKKGDSVNNNIYD